MPIFMCIAAAAFLLRPPAPRVRGCASVRGHVTTMDAVQLTMKPARQSAANRAAQPNISVRQGKLNQAKNAALRGNTSGALDLALLALEPPPIFHCERLVRGCNKLLAILGDQGDLHAMEHVYGAMLAARLTPTQVTFGTLISRCALPPATTMRRPLTSAVHWVHGSCGSAGALKRALRCYHDMQQRGVPPDTQTVNSLINAFAKVGDVECAFRVAASMEHKQLAPTIGDSPLLQSSPTGLPHLFQLHHHGFTSQ